MEVPSDPEGEATDRTLLELRSEEATVRGEPEALAEEKRRTHADEDDDWRGDGDHWLAKAGEGAGRPPSETATLRDGLPVTPARPSRPVREMGPYELRRILGKGGMGVVYEAFQPALDRTVALKVISGEDAGFEELERFQREARAAARLKHPNIVPIHEVGVHEGRHYFTMDLVRGHTLQALARSGELAPERAARIVAKTALAIHYAHEQQIIHRDLKPSNILVDAHDEPHVMDFGLAKDQSEVSGLTLTGVAMGSPPYMPPEQARGEFKKVDAVSDVYGLGASLYECLTGRPPFKGKSLYDLIAKVLVEEPTPPRKVNPNVPYDLETVCLKALEKEKWRRYPTAKDMAKDLERVIAGETIRAARQGFTTRMGRVIERHKLQIFSVLIPVAVIASLAAYAFGAKEASPTLPPTQGVPRAQRGPITQAIEGLEGGGNRVLMHLLEVVPQRPSWDDVRAQLAELPSSWQVCFEFREIYEGRKASDPTDVPVPAEVLGKLALAHVKDTAVPLDEVAAPLERWATSDPALAQLVSRAALALRGWHASEAEAFRRALTGPPSVLDRSILRAAKNKLYPNTGLARAAELCPPGSPKRALAGTWEPPTQYGSGRIKATDETRTRWEFPPVLLPGERSPARRDPDTLPLPRVTGLVRPDLTSLELHPTTPLRDASARRVVIGWLRFLYLIDDEDGRILRRARLPGIAQRIDHRADGSYLLIVSEGHVEHRLIARVEKDDLELTEAATSRGGPERQVAAVDLMAPGELAFDQLRRVACAQVPVFDDLLWVWGFSAREKRPVVRERFDVGPPLGHRFRLGFSQGPATPCADRQHRALGRDAATITEVSSSTVLRPGDGLLDLRLPLPGSQSLKLVVARHHRRTRNGKVVEEVLPITPRLPIAERVAPSEWQLAADEAARALAASDDPNPWLQAFLAAAMRYATLPEESHQRDWRRLLAALPPERDREARRLARSAATSDHLGLRERVELGCFLDRAGLEPEADRAFAKALEDVVRTGAFLPGWAGYGALDPGRPLARRVEELWAKRRGERALVLTRWRNAFAPVLRESTQAMRTYVRQGSNPASVTLPADLAIPPPAVPTELAPAKGLARFEALSLQRFDHALLLQSWFFLALGGLLLLVFLRYRRHADRALSRIGAVGFVAQQVMWIKRPWIRLRYSWPTFFTLSDKLCFVILYVLFFGVFALQDAGLDVLLEERRAPSPLLAGLPSEATSLDWLENHADQATTGYMVAWAREARGLPALPHTEEDLRALKEPRADLLLAQIRMRAGADGVEELLASAAREVELGPLVAVLRARRKKDTAAIERLAPELRRRSLRIVLCLEATGELPTLLAPPPTPAERDRVLVGTDRWWKPIPIFLVRNMFQPWREAMDASVLEFEAVWQRELKLARLRNDWFFMIPATLVLLLASLFMPTVHPFEPLARDVQPPPLVRVFRLLAPGAAQFQRGRPVRGVLLLLPFLYVAHLIWYAARGYRAQMEGFETFLSPYEAAGIVAENVGALPGIRTQHYIELTLVLLLVYVLHWIDLALSQRKEYRASPERSGRVIVPVDSLASLAEAPEPSEAKTLRELPTTPAGDDPTPTLRDQSVGPFDVTERDLPRPPVGPISGTDSNPSDADFD